MKQIKARKKIYRSPTLTRFGSIAELTQSGSGSSESAGGSESGMTCDPVHMAHPNCNTP